MLQILLGIALWYLIYKWFTKHYTITAKEKRYTPEEFYAFLEQERAVRGNTVHRPSTKAADENMQTVRTEDGQEIDIVSDEEWQDFLKWRKWRQSHRSTTSQ
ncbi:hypothetical protein [Neisseria perflava]|uniref:hypothetical protein n=1 Tax=Neisseria perflava TaxID=33053 RepID=UPI00209EB532|nr:hypothetical protein [Neisseria perflava]MCP1660863.1 hypothetical protein [Neisseria perflava]MCP1772494.1 hypothetical protein [Neisseria perflava]